MSTDWLEVAKDICVRSRRLAEEIPPCRKCGCNWPKAMLNEERICPNCKA